MLSKVLLFLLVFIPTFLISQDLDVANYQKKYQLHIAQKTGDIKIDGELNEAAWQTKDSAANFWLKFPRDDAYAKQKTIVKSCYDANYLYISAVIFDKKPFIAQSLKRDSRIRENDGFGIVIDPINKKTNGFYFSVTAYNVQADDVMSGSDDDLNFSYDNKWYSATKHYDSCFTVEMAIPFKTLRYDNANLTWGINFIRSNKKANEFNTWTRIPVNFRGTDMGWLGALVFDKALPKPGKNISLIPYVNTGATADKINTANSKSSFNVGMDAKVALTPSLNLDLTVNPDFSQVEVDKQVTNLSRFSIFFPERRNFFLENSDLFSSFGIPPIRPFYSRRIGLDPHGRRIPIIGGARLSGNISEKTRIGILNMQTAKTSTYAAQNYTAITTQQQVLKRSSIKAYFLNRQGMFDNTNKPADALEKYGRNFGLENSYQSANGKYQAWLGYHGSKKDSVKNNTGYLNFGVGYNSRTFETFLNFDQVGKNYYTDLGFVERIASYYGNTDSLVRNGFKSMFHSAKFSIFPKSSKKINRHEFEANNFFVLNPNGTFNERNHELNYTTSFKKSSSFKLGYTGSTVQLLVPLAITDGQPLPVARYAFGTASIGFESDSRKPFVYGAGMAKGTFYNGDYLQYKAKIIYRVQPKFTFELNAEYNKIELPTPYGKADLLLIAPRFEMNFTNNIFWTTFIQYNTQSNNVNFNSRLQWRFKPASDLFFVYTDNYYTDPLFKNKNRGVILKVNYWLNM